MDTTYCFSPSLSLSLALLCNAYIIVMPFKTYIMLLTNASDSHVKTCTNAISNKNNTVCSGII